jgi:transcriptional regulator with XRE-family HTH domain
MLRKRREARGMTLAQVAEAAGMSANYVGTIENGKRTSCLRDLINLARALGVPSEELMLELRPAGHQIQMSDDDRPRPPDVARAGLENVRLPRARTVS